MHTLEDVLQLQLVLINMSDHVMRTKVAANNASNAHPRVIGCLLGQTTGRTVDISNSFELLETTTSDGAPAFDQELFTMRLEQYQEVFKSLEVIGWYATGSGLQPSDLTLHKRFAETMDAPILLSLDADATMVVGAKELPVALYESGAA
jgi:COP9 signalosome complex subunit 6